MAAKWNKKNIIAYMQVILPEYVDAYEEVNCTAMAEDACQHFDAWGPAPNYDAPEEFFEYAYDVAVKAGYD